MYLSDYSKFLIKKKRHKLFHGIRLMSQGNETITQLTRLVDWLVCGLRSTDGRKMGWQKLSH